MATCEPLDEEMERRIASHKKSRPKGWRTFEAPLKVSSALSGMRGRFEIVIVDCITLLVSNLLLKGLSESAIEAEIKKMCRLLRKMPGDAIVVSNEVGLGIVPQGKLVRDFRDIAGRMNQIIAQEADEVFFMACALPLKMK